MKKVRPTILRSFPVKLNASNFKELEKAGGRSWDKQNQLRLCKLLEDLFDGLGFEILAVDVRTAKRLKKQLLDKAGGLLDFIQELTNAGPEYLDGSEDKKTKSAKTRANTLKVLLDQLDRELCGPRRTDQDPLLILSDRLIHLIDAARNVVPEDAYSSGSPGKQVLKDFVEKFCELFFSLPKRPGHVLRKTKNPDHTAIASCFQTLQ